MTSRKTLDVDLITLRKIQAYNGTDNSKIASGNVLTMTSTGEANWLPSSASLPAGSNYSDYLFYNPSVQGYQVGSSNVHIGANAGKTRQGNLGVAIGSNAGNNHQGVGAVAIGNRAGEASQGTNSIVIGNNAGLNNVGYGSVGIGYNVGSDQFSSNAVAIGPNIVNVNANSIFLNASNANVGSSNPGFFVNPVRNNTGSTGFVMQYNPVTHEILYNSASSGSVTGTGTVTLAGDSIGKMLVTGPSGIAFSSSIEVVNTPFQGIAVSGDLIPTSNNTFSLGDSDAIWKDIWVGSGSVHIGGAKISSSSQDIILSGGITATRTSFIAGVVLGGSNITASVSESSSIGGVTLVNSGITANASSIIGGVTLANSGITATGTFYNGNLTINSSNIYRNTNEEIYLNNVVFKSDGANAYIGSVQNGYFMTLSSTTLVVNAGKTFNAATINSTNGIFQGSSLGGAQFYLSTIDGSRPIITGNGAPGVDSLFLGPTPGNPLLGITSSNSSNFVTIYGANNYNTTIQNGVITTPLLATSQIGGVSIGNYSIQTVFNSSNFIGGVTLVNSNIVCSNITGNVLFSVANI